MSGLPEGYLPREGDVLIVRARVKFDVEQDDEDVHLTFEDGIGRAIVLPLDKIISIYSRHWNIGDKVLYGDEHEHVGEVRAIEGEAVWVKTALGVFVTYHANGLKPAPTS